MIKNTRIVITLALLSSLLIGCAPGPERPPTDTATDAGSGRELSEIEQLLLQAETAPPLARAQYTLEAAKRLIAEERQDRAEALLRQINPLLLSDAQQQLLWLLQGELSSANQQPAAALDWLERIQSPELLTSTDQARLAELRAAGLNQLGDIKASTLALIQQSKQVSDDQQQALSDHIWQQLLRLDDSTIDELLGQQNDYLTQGWLELSELMRRPDADILETSEQLNEWHSLWSLHPAASHLPQPLAPLRELQAEPPRHIGVLLPQSGKLAEPARALIEGFMAAHYRARQRGRSAPLISFFDSEQIDNLGTFYLQAELRGIDLIVGPLDKDQLNQLADKPLLGITTLGMNYVDHNSIAADLYQFGLRGEDEARQAARQAWQDGHRIALTLTPTTNWGDRILRTFRNEWQSLGGIVADSERFTGDSDYSTRISRLLAVDQSELRADQLRQLLGEKIEFDTRRRQDVDFLFLAALNKDARQIKPTLAFHFAGDLPVYATSHVYSGQPNPERDRDLDGVLFSDIPWVLDDDLPLRADIERQRKDSSSRFGRLYALGADAYRLAPYLTQLQSLPGTHLSGLSGDLQVDANGEVLRSLEWATFRNGRVRKQSGQ
ncbi:penicillin-binding protein activator [Motiliproteus sediminis]|uniref:penicillin-binding protein activator n=1 Tax=Motiliproteus sediminis TaxID=1468178 RepID=UPI001AEF4DAB|nr:penicillin-binding protein activator [Motiliproteus sediminis]